MAFSESLILKRESVMLKFYNGVILVSIMVLNGCSGGDSKQRREFVAGCTQGGNPKPICSCVFDSIEKNYTQDQLDAFDKMMLTPRASNDANLLRLKKFSEDVLTYTQNCVSGKADQPVTKKENRYLLEKAIEDTLKPHSPQENSATVSSADSPAACTNSKLVFVCTTTKGKTVEVCDSGDTLQYRFGKKGQPSELSLSVPRSEASTFQWDGRGSNINYSVQIPNGNTVYEVFTSMDRMSDEHDIVSGINVKKADDQLVATLTCVDDTVEQDMEDISLKPASWQ